MLPCTHEVVMPAHRKPHEHLRCTMADTRHWTLQNGVAAVAWGPSGYKLTVAEVGSAGQVLELGLAKSLRASHRIASSRHASSSLANQEAHLLQVHLPVQPAALLNSPCTHSLTLQV